MSHNLFPTPAAVLPGEVDLMRGVLANPGDDLPKLVYADWLEERQDARGPFLRNFVYALQSGGELPSDDGISFSWCNLMGLVALTEAWDLELSLSPSDLIRRAIPGMLMSTERCEEHELRIGATKFGGHPDVPKDFEWPESTNGSLSFLAQFDLSELSQSPAAYSLPRDGWLSVFHSRRSNLRACDSGEWRVYHFSILDEIDRLVIPPGLREIVVSQPCRLNIEERLVFPEDVYFDSDEEYQKYREAFCQEYRGHWLLGYPQWLRGEPPPGSEVAKGRHLLTLDSDENPEWMWGGDGSLYFFLGKKSLAAKNFHHAEFFFED